METKNIEIIFDNGGGITLQKTTEPYYMHNYNDANQVADDIQAIIDGSTPNDWDGNEYDDMVALIVVDYDDERNGGYRSYRLDNLLDIVNDPDDDEYRDDFDMPGEGWNNVSSVIELLRG
jgi:hypothetical protein